MDDELFAETLAPLMLDCIACICQHADMRVLIVMQSVCKDWRLCALREFHQRVRPKRQFQRYEYTHAERQLARQTSQTGLVIPGPPGPRSQRDAIEVTPDALSRCLGLELG